MQEMTVRRKEVNVGTERWPFMAVLAVGDTVPGFNPIKDTTVQYKGLTYSFTGKRGTTIKTGEPTQEFQAEGERRIWVTDSGSLTVD